MAVTEITHTSAKKITFAWTSDGDGDASQTTVDAYDGQCIALTTIPSGGSAPTDNYDITITDADSHDVLLGAGANRDTANTEHVVAANLACVAGSLLILTVSNAGDTKAGTAILWVR